MKTASAIFCLLLLAALSLPAAPLVSCPDCAAPVSARALFCPQCGAPGDAIAASGSAGGPPAMEPPDSTSHPQDAPPPPPPSAPALDNILLARLDTRTLYALPVAFPDGPAALLPAAALTGFQTLELTAPSTAQPVPYGPPALSADGRLVRLPLPPAAATNLHLHPIAPDGAPFDCAATAPPPPGPTPVASVRIPAAPAAPDIPLSPAIIWNTLSPRALKAALQPQPQETP